MTAFLMLTALIALSVLAPFLGEDTRSNETWRRRGSFLR